MNTTKLNKTTQKARRWIEEYNSSSDYSVTTFYGRCSYEKISIENDIKKKMTENNCHGYKILSGNCFHFVCGYKNQDNTSLYIETIGNTWEIKL